MDNFLRDEVNGGDWDDEVGRSYQAYTENLCRMLEKIVAMADSLSSIERSLDSFDEYGDREKLEEVREAVEANRQ